MSFASAMRGTQVNQQYRKNAAQLQNHDRRVNDDLNAWQAKTQTRGNMIDAFGSAVNLMDSAGANLTSMGKGAQLAAAHGLEKGELFGSTWLNTLNPFKRGGFGATYSGDGTGPMTYDDLSKTGQAMNWSQAMMGNDAFSFKDAAEMSMSDNPLQSLMGRYNAWNNRPLETKVKENLVDTAQKTPELDELDDNTNYNNGQQTGAWNDQIGRILWQ